MDASFLPYIEDMDRKLHALLAMPPVTPTSLPKGMPARGVYLLSEGDTHLYVGRSSAIRKRLESHSKPSASYREAAFAFRLAREATNNLKATYKKGPGSRAHLILQPDFLAAFIAGKARIRAMNARYVEEIDPVKQALLEVYIAVVLKTPYNDFDNH